MGEEHGEDPVSLARSIFSSACSEEDIGIAVPILEWGLSQTQGVPRRDGKEKVVGMERWIQGDVIALSLDKD